MSEQEEQKIFEDYNQQMTEYAIERQNENNDVLSKVQDIVSQDYFKDIAEYLQESGEFGGMEIIDNRKEVYGSLQEEDYLFKCIYITQSCGMTGDDYSGTIFIPLGDRRKNDCKYLKFDYQL